MRSVKLSTCGQEAQYCARSILGNGTAQKQVARVEALSLGKIIEPYAKNRTPRSHACLATMHNGTGRVTILVLVVNSVRF